MMLKLKNFLDNDIQLTNNNGTSLITDVILDKFILEIESSQENIKLISSSATSKNNVRDFDYIIYYDTMDNNTDGYNNFSQLEDYTIYWFC